MKTTLETSGEDVKTTLETSVVFQAGEVIRVDIPAESSGRIKGFATVLYKTTDEAQRAISMFNDYEFEGSMQYDCKFP